MCNDGLTPIQSSLSVLLVPDEHMTEDDKGLYAEQFNTDLALLQHKQAHPISTAESLEWCEDCGNSIPELRRKAITGVTQCIECAREAEKQARLLR